MGKILTVAALAFGLVAASQAHSQGKPEDLVRQRQAGMTMIAKYFAPIGAMVQGKVPYNADVVARNGDYLEVLAKLPWDGFQASTADVLDTKTKPETYKNMAKFNQAADAMQDAMAKLVAAAKSRDEAAVKAAFGGVGKACKGCHDDFRSK